MKVELKSSRPLRIGVSVLTGVAVLVTGYWFLFIRGIVTTDDARFQGNLIDVAALVPGRLISVDVQEGDQVHMGQLLFRVDDSGYRAGVSKARAVWEAAKARFSKAQNGPLPEQIRIAVAHERKSAVALTLANLQLQRVQKLAEAGSVSQQALDQARAGSELARQSHEVASQNLQLLHKGTRVEDLAAAAAQTEAARAGLEQAEIALAHTAITALTDGVIVKRWHNPGDAVAPGIPVVTEFDPKSLYIAASIQETELAEVRVGDRVDVDVDAYPNLRIKGRIAAILPTTRSQFSVLPSEGVSGTFIKVTQRVPLRIQITHFPSGKNYLFAPGLSVEIAIHKNTATDQK